MPGGSNTRQNCTYKEFMACKPLPFKGTEGPVGLTHWIEKMESVFSISNCTQANWVKFATSTVEGKALTWWNSIARPMGLKAAHVIPWEDIKTRMTAEYCPDNEVKKMEAELWDLKIIGTDLATYTNCYLELILLCPGMLPTERKKIDHYVKGLSENIQASVHASKPQTLQETINMANDLMDQITQRTVAEVKAGDNKRKWTGNSNSQSSKKQEVSVKGYQGKAPYWSRCERHHEGRCTVTCGKCKKIGHLTKNCWSKTTGLANPPAANTGTVKTCYECGQKGHFRNECPNKKGPKKGRGRSFNINAHEAREDPDLVTGTFLLNNHIVSVLFNCGANRSFVSIETSCMLDKTHVPIDTKYCIELVNGKLMKANKIYKDCTLVLEGKPFLVDLMPIEIRSFNVVIGMDWLSKNRAEVVCFEKVIRIPLDNGENLMVYGDKTGVKLNLISCMKAQKYLRKDYQAILVHVKEIETEEKRIEDVPIVREFPNVFLEELTGLPPHRSVEFQKDLVPGAAPVARSPYRLAPSELKELSNQLQELLDRGFIRPSSSPRFIEGFSKIARSLTALTHKGKKYEWSDVHEAAFQLLK
ncbi:uncharacterized protein [Rutidosis leptorrhynchoides]|uniref:uncharacterized protein n=1 Tax=Rutidosis leptorrhynchoides TaxID=125765 RepID=UPI003A9A5880